MNIVTIALVDDHRVVGRSLRAYLESFPDLRVTGIASSGEELLKHLDEWNPRIVIADMLMPGGIDGIETTRRIRERAPHVQVIALTASTDEARMVGVLRAGASGYVRKDAEPEVLLAAVRAVAAGRSYIDPSAAGRLIEAAARFEDLTSRELDVLRQLSQGRSNKEIAGVLSISEETVKTHVSSVLAKLNAGNRAHAIVQAFKRGVISLDEVE